MDITIFLLSSLLTIIVFMYLLLEIYKVEKKHLALKREVSFLRGDLEVLRIKVEALKELDRGVLTRIEDTVSLKLTPSKPNKK